MYGFRIPEDFLIGTANSAFQSEGAMDRDGKSQSIMEYYGKKYEHTFGPHFTMEEGAALGKAPFGPDENARGCEFYDNYESYIEDMQKTGQNTFRITRLSCFYNKRQIRLFVRSRSIPDIGEGRTN